MHGARSRASGIRAAAWLLLCLLVPAGLSAQQTSMVVGRYQLDVWRFQDNVRLAYTSNLVQGRDGYLWLSSQSGLTRFDGSRFRVFDGTNTPALRGRPRLLTYPLLADGDGRLWVASDIGLFTYDGEGMRPVAVDSAFQTDLANAATVDRDGTVWVVTRSGRVLRLPRGRRLQEVPGTVRSYAGSSVSVDRAGDVWIAAGEGAVYRVHEGRLSRVTFPPGVPVDNPSRVYGTRDGSVWLGTPTALVRWRGGRLERLPLPSRAALGAVSAIAEGPDGTLWIGTHGAGLYWFDGRRFTPFTSRDGLSDDRVIDILPDRSGNVWVATRDGLNRFRPLPFDVFTARSGLTVELPGGMVRDREGRIWLAPPTGGLLYGEIGRSGSRFTRSDAVRNYDRVTALVPARAGGVWVGQPIGLVQRVDGDGSPARPVVQGLAPVTDVLEDPDGTLWIATWRGVSRLRDGRLRTFMARDGLPDDHALRLFRDSGGTLWVATLTGVARAVGSAADRFVPRPMPPGSAERAVTIFEAPRGTVWAGSDEGLARLAGGRPAFLTTAHGLPESWVGAGEMDGEGHLWLGQLGGLARVSIRELLAVADGRAASLSNVTTYEALDGLPGGDPGAWPHPWSFRDGEGTLWFAMARGIVAVDPAHAERVAHPPTLRIEEALVDGAAVPAPEGVTLDPGARRLEVRYTGVDLTDGPRVRFRYRLDGFDTTWVDAGTQRVAAYTRLAPGRYRFRVSARDASGGWSAEEARLGVLVRAPVYRQTWFVVLVGLVLAAALWSLHRTILHTRSAAIYDERSRLAREIHDSLLQGFGGIALQLHAASMRLALPPTQQQHLDRVLSLVDRTLTQAREMVWEIRQPGAPPEELAAACEEAGRRIFEETATTVRVVRRGRSRTLPAATRTACLRIVEEALTNARKHARASHVEVTLTYGWTHLRLSVRDDGAGFDRSLVDEQGGHWGLMGIEERASGIGASLSVESRPGKGTRISLSVPYRRWLSWLRGADAA